MANDTTDVLDPQSGSHSNDAPAADAGLPPGPAAEGPAEVFVRAGDSSDNGDETGSAAVGPRPGSVQGADEPETAAPVLDGCAPEERRPRFLERADAAGLDHVQAPPNTSDYYNEVHGVELTFGQRQAVMLSGGAAAGDYDGDGWVDLYMSRQGEPGILYRNLGDGTFEDVTEDAGFGLGLGTRTNGAGWADLDNDGDLDLFVTNVGGHFHNLWINDGEGRFTEQGLLRGVSEVRRRPVFGQSVSFGDFDRDGYLDIHTTEWNTEMGDDRSVGRLFHNRGAERPGYFEDVTEAAGIDTIVHGTQDFSLTSVFSDLDDDGYPDLAISGDFGHSHLYWNRGDGTFEDGTAAAGVGEDENGMGGAVGDYDGDGLLDWFVTSIYWPTEIGGNVGTTGNRLYRNLGGRRFEDMTDEAGVRNGYWGWGTTFFDADNDADLDLVMTNGSDLHHDQLEQFQIDPVRFWRNDCGAMTESSTSAGLADTGDGKGLLSFDYDRDGDLDLVVVNHAAKPLLFENQTPNSGDWLRIVLHGRESNSFGIGARVRVFFGDDRAPLVRELRAGGNYLSQDEAVLHVGLGGGMPRVPRIEITWPTPGERKVQVLTDVETGMVLEVTEPE